MAYPDKTTPRSYGGAVPPSYLTTDIPNYYVANQAITIESAAGWYEVSDTGQATTTPLGTRGPFVVTVNAGEANEERILCSDIDIEGNFLTVWTDGVLNGRGYDGTIIQWHYRQTTQNKTNDIFHGASAVESLQFNEGIIAALIGGQGGQGAQGVQGAQGTQGAQGNQGATGTGTQGSQGAQGATATGTQGSQGAQGAQGAGTQGSQGTQGDQGPQGNDGSQGSQGSDGAQGYQGNDGAQGFQGNDGAQGFQGDQGLQGYQGQADRYATYSAAYTNIPTTFPFTDDISVNGGLAYSAGQGIVIAIDGTDYAVATVNAYDAVTGILNFTIAASTDIHGNPFQGFSWGYAVNLDGAVGPQGTQGFQGDQGPQGNDGSQGSQGNDGAQGSQGNDGAQGSQGNDGSQGPQGTDALWNFSGPYNPGLIYTTGDVVTYEGQTWYRLIYGAPGRTPGDNIWWTLVAAEGSQGAQGLTGDPGIYESADGVPPVNEDILWLDETVAGYAGPQGPQGVQGVQGARGYQGSVGAQGASGTNGTNGSQGAQGTQGLQGSTGSQGSQGNAGTQGPQGASGTNGSQGPQGSQGNQGNSFSTDDSGWIAVSSFTNSFVVGAAVAYRKLNGIVYLRGSVQSGTPANAAFTLPTGYRPSETSVFAIQQYGLTTNNYITINTDGTVVPQTASAWLNNVVYPIG